MLVNVNGEYVTLVFCERTKNGERQLLISKPLAYYQLTSSSRLIIAYATIINTKFKQIWTFLSSKVAARLLSEQESNYSNKFVLKFLAGYIFRDPTTDFLGLCMVHIKGFYLTFAFVACSD